jgi:inner membrane protease ATP23
MPRGAAQVVMCHNHMQSATEFENMLVHELVHAFDHCRGADLSWSNCRHHACSEARAAAALRAACACVR